MCLRAQGWKDRHVFTYAHQANNISQLSHWNQLLRYTVAGLAVRADTDSQQHSVPVNGRVGGIRIDDA